MVFRANCCTYRLTGLDYYHYCTIKSPIFPPSALYLPLSPAPVPQQRGSSGDKDTPRGHAGTSQMVSNLHHHYLSSSSPPMDDASPRHLLAADRPLVNPPAAGGYSVHGEEHPETFARSISGQTVKYNHRHHYEMKRGETPAEFLPSPPN